MLDCTIEHGAQYKYSIQQYNENGIYSERIESNVVQAKFEDSFLYDGNDLYFFITEGTVTFSNQSIKIPPMSYVSYTYGNGELYIYNYDEDKVYYYPAMIDGDVIYKNDIFELNISSDSVKSGTKNKLLRKNIDDLNRLK